jgi:hypothetical protein
MRNILFLIGLLFSSSLLAQWVTQPITPANGTQRTDGPTTPLPAIGLPFWDDFSVSGETPGDLWEYSDGIYVNATLGINAPSYKVATFDGINAAGQIYDDVELYPGLTDQLASRRIDLSSYVGNNTLYLSFFWEMGGNGERPENSGDSLRLQFLNSDSVWVTQWKRQATQVTVTDAFAQVILPLTAAYRHGDFRFKFESFGSQQGPFDTWHVDYVYLNNGRTTADLKYFDRTFTGSISKLFDPYVEMPAAHFFIDPSKYLTLQKFQGSNLDINPHNLILGYELHNTNTDEKFTFSDNTNSFNSGEIKTVLLSQVPNIPAQATPPDSIVFINTITSNFSDPTSPINYRQNDTLRARYNLYDYYAYDDGTAEYTAGVRQNGTVAMRYVIETQDTLTHIDIHFPTTSPSPVGKVLTFKVWKDLDEEPVASKLHTVALSGQNEFVRIPLNPAVIVQDTIYIGYTQKSADYVGIGLDRSNVSANDKIYYRIVSDWQQNEELNGVLMMRAVFEDGANLVLGTNNPLSDLVVYPNPTNGLMTIQGNYTAIKVLSLGGKELFSGKQKTSFDLSFLPTGVYLLEVLKPDQTTAHFKIVKK